MHRPIAPAPGDDPDRRDHPLRPRPPATRAAQEGEPIHRKDDPPRSLTNVPDRGPVEFDRVVTSGGIGDAPLGAAPNEIPQPRGVPQGRDRRTDLATARATTGGHHRDEAE